MVKFVQKCVGKPLEVDLLQRRVLSWWRLYSSNLADEVLKVTQRDVPLEKKGIL